MFPAISVFRYRNFFISALPSAFIGTVIFFLALVYAGIQWMLLPVNQAVIGSLLIIVLHWFSVTFHNLGHHVAAISTGYPMIGIRYWLILGTSLYPPDEPPLPKSIHVRRVMGGPVASAILGLVAVGISYLLMPTGGVIWYVFTFIAIDNLFLLSLGAFLPLGFTDGSTLIKLRSKPDPTRM
jgi:hypothetical protein